MYQCLGTFASGLDAAQKQIAMVADNMSKSSVNGYKQRKMVFLERVSSYERTPGTTNAAGNVGPTGIFIGNGVQSGGTITIDKIGNIEETGDKYHMAIRGSGYFIVRLPDGNLGYTRDGTFIRGASGRLETAEGYPLVPEVNIPVDSGEYDVSTIGRVTAKVNGQQQDLGQIQLAIFNNNSGLAHKYGNIYTETDASGPALVNDPGQIGYGLIKQKCIEKSNVDTVMIMTEMITVNRLYDMLAKGLKTCDNMWQSLNAAV